MGKKFTSPVEYFPGYIVMPDHFEWPQMIAWDESIEKSKTVKGLRQLAEQANGVLLMVDEWHITGIDEKPNTLPASPVRPAIELIGWIVTIINNMLAGVETPDPFLSSD